jgi:hypothetical protein
MNESIKECREEVETLEKKSECHLFPVEMIQKDLFQLSTCNSSDDDLLEIRSAMLTLIDSKLFQDDRP